MKNSLKNMNFKNNFKKLKKISKNNHQIIINKTKYQLLNICPKHRIKYLKRLLSLKKKKIKKTLIKFNKKFS